MMQSSLLVKGAVLIDVVPNGQLYVPWNLKRSIFLVNLHSEVKGLIVSGYI